MEISQLIPHVEALIFAGDRPLPMADIVELLNNALAFLEDRATPEQVEAAIDAIKEKYSSEFYAFEIRESGGGYQFLTKKEYYQTVAQLNGEKFLKRLSTAALETLAIVAYRQPISKGEIEHIRGVSTDYSIQKLLEKDLIVISGRSEDLPGKPLLYSTSKAFMDYFGLNSPNDLPKLKEVFEEEYIQPTLLNENGEAIPADAVSEEDEGRFVVSNNGELQIEPNTVQLDDPDATGFATLKIDEEGIQPQNIEDVIEEMEVKQIWGNEDEADADSDTELEEFERMPEEAEQEEAADDQDDEEEEENREDDEEHMIDDQEDEDEDSEGLNNSIIRPEPKGDGDDEEMDEEEFEEAEAEEEDEDDDDDEEDEDDDDIEVGEDGEGYELDEDDDDDDDFDDDDEEEEDDDDDEEDEEDDDEEDKKSK
ncbi:segregation and condensation protein B [Chitinophaga skermanii]|uniref:Segregation and condensation protein B n=1 Tax=Chitinophaga skermanii TaxID=331697 RepID=A0A327R2B2_9BACT|nr:SMC-Scp complex subunit ScpB [Chitinophaga skermanii]RAJ10771.1 segregation and condensation protein B [Chitinophaga skermanii]